MEKEKLCIWCEKQSIPKKRQDCFCSDHCEKDHEEYVWPSWMNGRIGKTPLGLDFDFPSFDQILIWHGPAVKDTF